MNKFLKDGVSPPMKQVRDFKAWVRDNSHPLFFART